MKIQTLTPDLLSKTDAYWGDAHYMSMLQIYPLLVHLVTYRRTNRNLHVHGYREEGTNTASPDVRIQNDLNRFLNLLKVLTYRKQRYLDKLIEHERYTAQHAQIQPEYR